MDVKMKVHSLRVENRTYEGIRDETTNGIINILNCVDNNGFRYELSIYEEDRECYSGYCGATYGYATLREVDSFIGITHVPIKDNLTFDLDYELVHNTYNCIKSVPDMKNNIFTIDYEYENGNWYPDAECTVNMNLFKPIIRAKEKRPVWIFKGDSGLGKSYIAGIIRESGREKIIYETDSNSSIDEYAIQYADIIVIGNKYKYEVEDIISYLDDEFEIIVVNFNKN